METFTVRVTVEITPSTDAMTTTPQPQADGSFQITIPAPDALSIDHCEQALLRTAYPAFRTALSTHLSAMSKKTPASKPS
jgi:hypothetical protein